VIKYKKHLDIFLVKEVKKMTDWTREKVKEVPVIKVTPPGPKSLELHSRASEYMKGYSGQVRLFPVVFEKGWDTP